LDHLGLGRLGAKAIDERLGMSALAILVGAGLLVDLILENDLRVSLGRAAFEFTDLLPVNHRGVRRHAIHEKRDHERSESIRL
jgi:hypothetical protein